MNSIQGVISALIGAITFGLIPLFALPVLDTGMTFYNLLFYRLIFASAGLGMIMIIRKKTFRLEPDFVLPMLFLAFCNTACSFFVIWGYDYISSGLVTSLRFLYPVLVSVAMICFFGEKKSFSTGLSIFLAVLGVSLLSYSSDGVTVNLAGVIIVLISSVWYAIYLIGTNKSKTAQMDIWTFTFYSMFFGAVFCLAYAVSQNNVQPVPADWNVISHLMGLILIATLLPNLALVDGVRRIGSTMTAVLGAFEPVTAVIVGVWIFHEPFTERIAFSVACILASVFVLIVAKNAEKIKKVCPDIMKFLWIFIKKITSKTIYFFKSVKQIKLKNPFETMQ